jgi:hypothetical protein
MLRARLAPGRSNERELHKLLGESQYREVKAPRLIAVAKILVENWDTFDL